MNKLTVILLNIFVGLYCYAQNKNLDGIYLKAYGKPTDQALVFVHGGPGYNSWDFELTTAPQLAKLGFYVVVFDERGQGRSQPVDISAYNYKQYADDIKAIIDNLNLKKPVLLGHSHGGPISIQFEKFYPNIVDKIVLISGPVRFESSMHALINHCAEKYQQTGDQSKLNDIGWVDYTIYSDKSQTVEDLANTTAYAFQEHGLKCGIYSTKSPTQQAIELYKQERANPIQGVISGDKALLGFLKNENYIKFDLSTFVYQHQSRFCGIYGNEDGLFTPTELSVIQNLLRRADGTIPMKVISGASHALYVDQQQDFFKALKETCGLNY